MSDVERAPTTGPEYWRKQHNRLPSVLREHVTAVLRCEAEPHVIEDAVAAVEEAANLIEALSLARPAPDDAVVERVSRAICVAMREDPETPMRVSSHPDYAHIPAEPRWKYFQHRAVAAIEALAKAQVSEDVSIFLDCDGVLADFDTYAEAYFGMPPRAYEAKVGSKQFWAELEAKGDFYRNLPLMSDARDLVDGVRHLKPTILTGCPRGNWAEAQKIAWAHEHFPDIPVITCRSADKRLHAKAGDVLIDDWPQHRHRWIEMGGVFISHSDATTSLAALWAHYPRLGLTTEREDG